MDQTNLRGYDRERNLSREIYYSQGYFSLVQLCSLSQQIHEIYKLSPRNIIEIGIGNGFVSTFLRSAGYEICTADINPSLLPDICASIEDLPNLLNGKRFDLVVCCEVLEHISFDEFDTNLDHLQSLGDRLFMTLPNYRPSIGFSGFLRLPKLTPRLIDLTFDLFWNRRIAREHFWEVGSDKTTSEQEIMRHLKDRYKKVISKRLILNPYHIAFYSE